MKKHPKLLFCILMDLTGYVSYAIPVFGEWFDVLWAPVSAFIFLKAFGSRTGAIGSFINLAEEILPFTDFIPTFSLAYLYQSFKQKFKN